MFFSYLWLHTLIVSRVILHLSQKLDVIRNLSLICVLESLHHNCFTNRNHNSSFALSALLRHYLGLFIWWCVNTLLFDTFKGSHEVCVSLIFQILMMIKHYWSKNSSSLWWLTWFGGSFDIFNYLIRGQSKCAGLLSRFRLNHLLEF